MADKNEKGGAEKIGEAATLPPDVFKVQARMPPFWPEEPEIWFSQIEGQFAIAGITNDTMKFNYVISQLDRQFSKTVKDIIISPPTQDKYIKLKHELIKRLSDINEKKAHQILMHEELGDRKPSRLLRHIQRLAGDKGTEGCLRAIWTRSLPLHIQAVVAAQPTESLDVLSDLADKIHDIAQPAAHASAICMAKEIAELRKQVEALTTPGNRKSGSHHRNEATPTPTLGQSSDLGGQTGAVLHFNLNTVPDAWGRPLYQLPGYPNNYPLGQPAPVPNAFTYVPAGPFMMSMYPSAPVSQYSQSQSTYVPQQTSALPTMNSYDPVDWVPTTRATASSLAHRALVAGKEGWDGSPLWVIRAHHGGEFIPGKLAIKHQSAYVPYAGEEVPVDNFELLCAPEHLVKWVTASNGDVPLNAIIAGNSRSAEPLYICRAKHLNSITPGKVHPSHRCAFISFGGSEIRFSTYEVLCKKTREEILAINPEI